MPLKMLSSEKNYLLSQIQIVLSQLESLVSKLNSAECIDSSVAEAVKTLSNVNFNESVKFIEEDKMSVSSVSSQQSQNLLWDTSEDFPVYNPTPGAFYNLYFSEEMSDEEIIFPQFECQAVQNPQAKESSLVEKLKSFLSSNFPTNVYSQQKSSQIRKEWMNEGVFIEFQSMWNHVDDLFVQNSDDSSTNCTTTPPPPAVRYNTIDFSKVNVRSIANIPRPERQAVHGCSQDPKFYSESVVLSYDYYNRPHTLDSSHKKTMPFGSLFGYQTNIGVVPVPDTPVHGYIWCHDSGAFVLHAMDPAESSTAPPRTPWTRTRGSTTRTPSTRRRWPT